MSKKRKAWRASQQRAIVGATASERQEPANDQRETPPHLLRGLARSEWIDRKAQEMYERMVGDSIDLAIRACRHTADAYNSQMAEAKSEGQAWGPDVTPYEARMTGSLHARLLREKRAWLRDFRQQIEQALNDEAAAEEEQAEANGETGARSASDGETTEGGADDVKPNSAPSETASREYTDAAALAARETS